MQVQDSNIDKRINTLVDWIQKAKHLVIFTGAGISTDSGLPDYRGPEGLWTRQGKGLPVPGKIDWAKAEPNMNHYAITELQNIGRLAFLITQNVDNLHLRAGIHPDLIAELHGNIYKLRCVLCESKWDNYSDLDICPNCDGKLVSSVVDFGDPMPGTEMEKSERHCRKCDLFMVIGSSLVVHPAADMPKIALRYGAKLIIINQGETPLDQACHLRFEEKISEVLPEVVTQLKELL